MTRCRPRQLVVSARWQSVCQIIRWRSNCCGRSVGELLLHRRIGSVGLARRPPHT
ncbi:UNVERIFIED_CONTAM: hypothetical protein GTU68_000763 [Idotea baltica]|nr:hypothetical protein [Idotea baltica]